MKVIYFGTPIFAADVLAHLLKNGVEIVAVITKPDRPQGRSGKPIPTPVKIIAQSQCPSIIVYQPEIVSETEFSPILKTFEADLFVVVAYGEIIKQHLLNMPHIACINLHASLLPLYRGAAPIQRAIMNGEKETGVTIMHMEKKMDAGDIISMEKVLIGQDTTYGELEKDLCVAGANLLLKTIQDIEKENISRYSQEHVLATFAPKIELDECKIDWRESFQKIHNLVRGVNPHPGAWCHVRIKEQIKRLKILKTQIISETSKGEPGTVMHEEDEILVNCGEGIIKLIELQLEGKKPLNSLEFSRGWPKLEFLNF